jgi:long-chain acyl-CoA synthetase
VTQAEPHAAPGVVGAAGPQDAGFAQGFLDGLARLGARPAVIEMHGDRERATSGAELGDLVAAARAGLRARGLRPGDRAALLAPNSARWIALDVAMLAEGLIVVPLYARQEPSELVAMMRDAGVSLVVCADEALAGGVRAHWPDAPVALSDEVLRAADAPVRERAVPRAPGDCVTLVYTSGTSGEPKGVMITRAGVDFMLPTTSRALRELMGPRAGDDRVFHYLPFCFMGSRIVLWTVLHRYGAGEGGGLWISTKLEDLAAELRGARPHYFLNVPALLERIKKGVEAKLAERPAPVRALYRAGRRAFTAVREGRAGLRDRAVLALVSRVVFATIRAQIGPDLVCLICGSAPLHPDTQAWFEMLGLPVYQVYGLTETTAIVTMDEPGRVEAGKVGRAIAGVELRLGEGDELLVRGPNVFAGYWRKPEATARAIVDGWLHTGDQCAIDPSGNLAVIGRVGNLLVAESGHNIPPEPIEAKILAELPGAQQCVVIGHARPFLVAIVTGELEEAEVRAAIDRVNASLPHYKRVRKFHVSRAPFTIESGLLTANQKLRRKAIEQHYRDAVEAMYR